MLNARDLGLLAGGYFLSFAATQLPLGAWLDRHGFKKGRKRSTNPSNSDSRIAR